MLDLIVRIERPLARGDDTPAVTRAGAGGQAANVAALGGALGAQSRLIAKWGGDTPGWLVAAEVGARRVEVLGPMAPGRQRRRRLRGRAGRRALDALRIPGWRRAAPGGAEARVADRRRRAVRVRLRAHARPGRRSRRGGGPRGASGRRRRLRRPLDLELDPRVRARSLPGAHRCAGAGRRVRDRARARRAARRAGGRDDRAQARAAGAVVRQGGEDTEHEARATEVVDSTGAGDALAAGFLVGGIELGLDAAARCVAKLGAMP